MLLTLVVPTTLAFERITQANIKDAVKLWFYPFYDPTTTALKKCGNISNWDTSSVTDMSELFPFAQDFNEPIGKWVTSKVTNMDSMFYGADAFHQPIGNWNTAKVTNMNKMFASAKAFNQPIGTWNTSSVIDMRSMFQFAEAFNQPIGQWKTSSVKYLDTIFLGASSFTQSLCWDLKQVLFAGLVFYDSAGSFQCACVHNTKVSIKFVGPCPSSNPPPNTRPVLKRVPTKAPT